MMRTIKSVAKRAWLPKLPQPLLAAILRRRPYLIDALPERFVLRWPYYLDDITVLVDRDNAIERSMFFGLYDAESTRIMRHFVRPGQTCVDVGANVGPITLLLAKLTGADGRVVAFEPGPPYSDKLARNLDLNPQLRGVVTVVTAGVSDEAGTRRWQVDPLHPYNAGLLHDDPRGIAVPVDLLDRFVEQLALRRIDFVKIDVEGMELEVLRGSENVLRSMRPIVLFETMETFREERGFDVFAEIRSFLKSVGYRMCNLTDNGALVDVGNGTLPANTIGVPTNR